MVFMVLNTLKHRKKVKYVDTKCKDRLCTVADNPGLVPLTNGGQLSNKTSIITSSTAEHLYLLRRRNR